MSDQFNNIVKKALSYPDIVQGESCNQLSFKAAKGKFLFIGPGPKGQGYKAMFKLRESLPEADKLSSKYPNHYQVGASGGWVTIRFDDQNPIPETTWEAWLEESYRLTCK